MLGIPNPYTIGIAAALSLAAVGGSYIKGRADGRAVMAEKLLKGLEAGAKIERVQRARVDAISGQLAEAQRDQNTAGRDIYHEATRIIERPVYRSMCVDADGGVLLDRARSNANRALVGEPAGGAATAPADAAKP